MLYENIKKACTERNISISFLEKTLGFPKSSMSKWDRNIPSVNKVAKAADYLGVSIDQIVNGTEVKK